MCGIAGIVTLGEGQPVDGRLAGRMADIIAHRGPDDAGVYLSPDRRAALANRRLAIIDLSPAGRQPMANEDGTVCLYDLSTDDPAASYIVMRGHEDLSWNHPTASR